MKRLILFLSLCSTFAWGQVYQHDFQKEISLPNRDVTNYTLAPFNGEGYATASVIDNASVNDQSILVATYDPNFNVLHTLECDIVGIGYGTVFIPRDIIQTESGDLAICGTIIIEGSENGGFLMYVRNNGKYGLVYDWIKIYPVSPADPDAVPVISLHKLIETTNGFTMIGKVQGIPLDGVILGVKPNGDFDWAREMYDTEYPGIESASVDDIVNLSMDEFAVVATVNGFPADDADLMIAKFKSDGTLINRIVYQNYYEQFKDYPYTYREYGSAIVYDRDREALTISGLVDKKIKGVCVEAEFRRIMVLDINASTLAVNWFNMYDMNADLLIANEGLRVADMAYDKESRTFGITGPVINDAFDPISGLNAYVLRIEESGAVLDLRYYGTNNEEGLERILPTQEMGTFACSGTKIHDGNKIWMVESYANILEECDEIRSESNAMEYAYHKRKGVVVPATVEVIDFDADPMLPLWEERIVCEKILIGKTVGIEETTQLIEVYPTVVTETINIMASETVELKIIELVTGKVIKSITVNGQTQLDVSNYANGIYLFIAINGNSYEEYKVVKQ